VRPARNALTRRSLNAQQSRAQSELFSLISHTVSDYRTTEKLGGGMSVIYKAEEMELCWFVALKLPEDLARRDRRKGAGDFPALLVVAYIS
jgi:hypothetical protein